MRISLPPSIKNISKKTFKIVVLSCFWLLVAFLIPQEYPVPGASTTLVSRAIGSHQFDFVEWLGDAWLEKLRQLAVPAQDFMPDEQRRQAR